MIDPFVRVPLRLIHVTRNPYDVIARMGLITKNGIQERPIDEAIPFVDRLAKTNRSIIDGGVYDVLTVRHEELIRDPRSGLRSICEFIGLDAPGDYLEACAGIVFESPHHTRELIGWSDSERAGVQELIDRYPFFAGYGWEGD